MSESIVGSAILNDTTRHVLERELARHERWLAGDWNSRSARGCDAAARHRHERNELRAALGESRCAACGAPMYIMIRGHHHAENGKDVT